MKAVRIVTTAAFATIALGSVALAQGKGVERLYILECGQGHTGDMSRWTLFRDTFSWLHLPWSKVLRIRINPPHASDSGSYVGTMTTGGTPHRVITKLNSVINEVVREPEFSTHFAALGYEMTGGTVEDFAKFIRDDTARYARLIKALGDVIE
jgi:hypothetical protein